MRPAHPRAQCNAAACAQHLDHIKTRMLQQSQISDCDRGTGDVRVRVGHGRRVARGVFEIPGREDKVRLALNELHADFNAMHQRLGTLNQELAKQKSINARLSREKWNEKWQSENSTADQVQIGAVRMIRPMRSRKESTTSLRDHKLARNSLVRTHSQRMRVLVQGVTPMSPDDISVSRHRSFRPKPGLERQASGSGMLGKIIMPSSSRRGHNSKTQPTSNAT